MTAKQQQLVTDNMNLVYEITKRYKTHTNYEDIVSEGMLGLCQAASNFDVIRGNNFSTYAYMTILGKVLVFVNTDAVVKPSRKDGKYMSISSFSLDADTEHVLYKDTIKNPNIEDNLCFYELHKRLDDMQIEIIKLLYVGYHKKEICARFGFTQAQLNKQMKIIKKGFQDIL